MKDLEGKVIIVTGAASGIGLATATRLLAAGTHVFGCDISASPSSISSDGNFKFQQCNLTESDAAPEVVKACTEAFGERIHGLLNIAGVMDTNNSVDTLRDEDWDRVIAVNLTAPVKLMRAVVPVMKAGGGGSIVNVSSKAGMSGAVAGVAYTASKHGLIGATKNVAWRFKGDKIRCNAICPGGVQTNITQSVDLQKMDLQAYSVLKPVYDLHSNVETGDGVALADDIASLLLFLSSDMSKEMSGSIIPVDHGWSTI